MCDRSNSFRSLLLYAYIIRHIAHSPRKSLSQHSSRDEVDSFPHLLSIAFVLYYSSLYHPVQIPSLVGRLARHVRFLASVCPQPLTNRTPFPVPTLIWLSALVTHSISSMLQHPRISYPIEQCFYNTVSAISRANYRVVCFTPFSEQNILVSMTIHSIGASRNTGCDSWVV